MSNINYREEKNANNALLQSYRQIFIGAQSFLLAVGTMTFMQSPILGIFVTAMSLFMIWYIWFTVVIVRGRVVDYFDICLNNPNDQIDCPCDLYSSNSRNGHTERKRINEKYNKRNWGLTRKKIDFITPIIFTFMWIVIAVYSMIYSKTT